MDEGVADASPIRVLLADDQALIRGGLRMILDAQDGIEVVGEAENGRQAMQLTEQLRPDVVLMDVRMPELDGIEATRAIVARRPTVKVLVLTTYDRDDYVYAALQGGASGFLLKTAPPARLTDAVRLVVAGEAMLAPTVTRRLIEAHVRRPAPVGQDPPTALTRLTERELQVLREMARGRSNSEIAATFVLSEATVKTHVNRILAKLDLRDRVQAVVFAYETGLVQPGEHPPG